MSLFWLKKNIWHYELFMKLSKNRSVLYAEPYSQIHLFAEFSVEHDFYLFPEKIADFLIQYI